MFSIGQLKMNGKKVKITPHMHEAKEHFKYNYAYKLLVIYNDCNYSIYTGCMQLCKMDSVNRRNYNDLS